MANRFHRFDGYFSLEFLEICKAKAKIMSEVLNRKVTATQTMEILGRLGDYDFEKVRKEIYLKLKNERK